MDSRPLTLREILQATGTESIVGAVARQAVKYAQERGIEQDVANSAYLLAKEVVGRRTQSVVIGGALVYIAGELLAPEEFVSWRGRVSNFDGSYLQKLRRGFMVLGNIPGAGAIDSTTVVEMLSRESVPEDRRQSIVKQLSAGELPEEPEAVAEALGQAPSWIGQLVSLLIRFLGSKHTPAEVVEVLQSRLSAEERTALMGRWNELDHAVRAALA